VRKDSLYCDAADSPRRRAYRTVLAALFDAIVAWLAPILVFTAEEAFEERHGKEAGSVHLGRYLDIPVAWRDMSLESRFERLRELRALATQAIEPMRREKRVGSSNEVSLTLELGTESDLALIRSVDFAELAIVSEVQALHGGDGASVHATVSGHARCARCWRHLPDVSVQTGLCGRCGETVAGAPVG
jgi:isoleucyl-tRNA synthetase